ncbi:TetR/AcrR family transcriptional regulator [Microlunatus soli]|uniref:DNA-binding transcriptional regulator, AcrR family n=1 Tax=Microlunatus soli TaxID=630515 RepID=A0A1H1WEI9_9ACTN|nr:TetR/AcrR family transcriptional regulator [Microlunatus soli]SDS95051.1 DNA-binding transcriptional regulator, AcrR family [Microlunatus soli]
MTAGARARTDKRRAILDAAAPIFGDEGYERARVEVIAAAAGVSKPTVYSYFGDKLNLFRESIVDTVAQQSLLLRQSVSGVDLSEAGWRQDLHRLGRELVACDRSDCNVFLRRMVAAESRRDPEILELIGGRVEDQATEVLAGRLAMLGNAGYLRIVDPMRAARQFYALVTAELETLTDPSGSRLADDRLDRAASAGVDTFLRAYEQPSERPAPTD